MSFIKGAISEIQDYLVPQTASRAKLNQNESPFDIPSEIRLKISRLVQTVPLNRYPSDRDQIGLKYALSDYTGIVPENIATGVGSNELIQAVMLACLRRGDKILVINPGFGIYTRLATILELQTQSVRLEFPFEIPSDKIIQASGSVDAIFIASPNNPTGTVLYPDDVEKILKYFKGLVVLDEAYFEFNDFSVEHLLNNYKNLLIMRTFSKSFGLAGIRLGYALGNQELITGIERCRMPFSLSSLQLQLGILILEEKSWIDASIRKILSERDRLYHKLSQMRGCQPVKSRANFILCRIADNKAKKIYLKLMKRGILVRYFETDILKDFLRITVGTKAENDLLLDELEIILSEREN